jgi:hypothetical protein
MEYKTIVISKKKPLAKRISDAGEELRHWLGGLDVPFNCELDRLQLHEFRIRNSEYLYSYRILRFREK